MQIGRLCKHAQPAMKMALRQRLQQNLSFLFGIFGGINPEDSKQE